MKRRYVKVLFFAIFFSFVWGLWWGYYKRYRERPESWARGRLSVLAEPGRFDAEFLEKFSRSEKIILDVTTRATAQEFLRELLTHRNKYDLIQVSSFLADSFMLANVFEELNDQRIRNLKNISVDFLSLNFDPENRYVLPLFWGVNGYVYHTETVAEPDSIQELLANPTLKAKVTMLPSPVELYTLATHFRPIIRTWVKTGNQAGVTQELKSVKDRFAVFKDSPLDDLKAKKIVAAQMASGEAAAFLVENADYRFFVPQERANLWVGLIGLSRDSKNKRLGEQTLGLLLSDRWNAELARTGRVASVLSTLNDSSQLPPLAKARFVREIRLSRFELFYDRETFEPVWLAAIKDVFPELWNSVRAGDGHE